MAGREVREYTNLTDPKDRKLGKGKDKIDDEDITFQRMVAKIDGGNSLIGLPRDHRILNQDHSTLEVKDEKRKGCLLSDSRLSENDLHVSWILASCPGGCKQMQEVAGERGGYLHGRGALDSDDLLYLKEQMEAEEDAERLLRRTEKRAFAAFKKAASLADSSPASVPLPLRVEPKPKSGIRQQDLLKNIVEIRPKRHRVSSESSPNSGNQVASVTRVSASMKGLKESNPDKELPPSRPSEGEEAVTKPENPVKGLLGLAYETSDDEED